MAYGFQTTKKTLGQENPKPLGPATKAGAVSAGPGASFSGTGATGERTNNTGGGWTNLQDFLAVNQDAAKGMAGKVQDKVGGAYDTAQKAYGNAGETFNADVRGGTLAGPKKVGNYTFNQAAENAAKGYSGPTDITQTQGWQEAEMAREGADAVAKRSQSLAGRETMLQDAYGGQANTLDSWLAGTQMGATQSNVDPNAYKAAADQYVGYAQKDSADAAGAWGKLRDYLGAKDAADKEAARIAAENAAAAARKATRDANKAQADSVTTNPDTGAKVHEVGSTAGLAPGQVWETPTTTGGQKGLAGKRWDPKTKRWVADTAD